MLADADYAGCFAIDDVFIDDTLIFDAMIAAAFSLRHFAAY